MCKSLRCVGKVEWKDVARFNQCKVKRFNHRLQSSGDETRSGIVSDEEIEKKELEAHYGFMAKIQEVSPAESSSTDTPLEQCLGWGGFLVVGIVVLIALQNKQNEFEMYKAFNDRTIDYEILQTKLNETPTGILALKGHSY
ncbi:hypothetical protein Tco_0493712 [Tanacetum coccineum]